MSPMVFFDWLVVRDQRTAKHLGDEIDWLKACQKRSEELAAILWIQLKIIGSCKEGHKQLILKEYLLPTLNRGEQMER